jgi:hypothetical protein
LTKIKIFGRFFGQKQILILVKKVDQQIRYLTNYHVILTHRERQWKDKKDSEVICAILHYCAKNGTGVFDQKWTTFLTKLSNLKKKVPIKYRSAAKNTYWLNYYFVLKYI